MTEDDTESDFLFSATDIGKPRYEVIKVKLAEMNPFVQIEFSKTLQECPKVSVVIASLSNFKHAVSLNEQVRALPQQPALYMPACCGQYGFAFVDLGVPTLKYTYSQADEPGAEKVQKEGSTTSKSLKDYLETLTSSTQKFAWTKRQSQKPAKMLFASVVH